MNVYDFDKTIYNGDSTADFYLFSLKRHKKIITLAPSLISAFIKYYVFKKGTKTDFKQVMYRFLRFCDTDRDIEDFWDINRRKIKKYYLNQKKDDDVIISASPEFLLEPIMSILNIKTLMASRVDKHTGLYDEINCHGKEKVRRFYEKFPNGKIDEFYSDSYSDSPLAEIAGKAYIVKGEKLSEWEFK
jgi:HAD superfamily phosphoserine phosphatase-like hydrolase